MDMKPAGTINIMGFSQGFREIMDYEVCLFVKEKRHRHIFNSVLGKRAVFCGGKVNGFLMVSDVIASIIKAFKLNAESVFLKQIVSGYQWFPMREENRTAKAVRTISVVARTTGIIESEHFLTAIAIEIVVKKTM